jgi:hypothetical protein
MNWYKQQLNKIADECFSINIPSSARIKKDIDSILETEISIKVASKIRAIVKTASNSKKRKEKHISKIDDFIDPSIKDQVKGIVRSYLGL